MSFIDSVKGTVSTAVDTIAAVTQEMVDKNRTNAKLNRLRMVMKNESELMNRAYIALGKLCYESSKKGEPVPVEQEKKLFDVIEKSKAKIAKARECYREIVDSTNDIFYGAPDARVDYKNEDVIDITVACSNESDYATSPFEESAADKCGCEACEVAEPEKAEEKAEPVAEKTSVDIFSTSSKSVADSETEEDELF